MENLNCDEFLNRNLSIIKEILTFSPETTNFKLFYRARKELIYVGKTTTNNKKWSLVIEQLQNEVITNTDDFFRKNIRVKIDEFINVFNEVSVNFNNETSNELDNNFMHILNFIKWFNNISFQQSQHKKNMTKTDYMKLIVETNRMSNDGYTLPTAFNHKIEEKINLGYTKKEFLDGCLEAVSFLKYELLSDNDINELEANESYEKKYKLNLCQLHILPINDIGIISYFDIIAIENALLELQQPQQESKTEYNTSQFNDFTFKLFNHIVNEYTTSKGKVKFINIWYFLKRDIIKKENIMFNFNQNDYKIFIKKTHTIEIKKFEKAAFKYVDTEKDILQNIASTYLKNLKSIENT